MKGGFLGWVHFLLLNLNFMLPIPGGVDYIQVPKKTFKRCALPIYRGSFFFSELFVFKS